MYSTQQQNRPDLASMVYAASMTQSPSHSSSTMSGYVSVVFELIDSSSSIASNSLPKSSLTASCSMLQHRFGLPAYGLWVLISGCLIVLDRSSWIEQ